MDRVKLDNVIAIVNGQLHPAGFDCLEAEWASRERILRLFVDHGTPEVGMTLDGCVQATRRLSDCPELDAAVAGRYTLEVSSPGIERPLRRREHFAKQIGACVDVKLRDKSQDRRNGKGKVLAVSAGQGEDALITLATDQGTWSFPLASLQRASLVYDWGDR